LYAHWKSERVLVGAESRFAYEYDDDDDDDDDADDQVLEEDEYFSDD
jgi:hypothetical protein